MELIPINRAKKDELYLWTDKDLKFKWDLIKIVSNNKKYICLTNTNNLKSIEIEAGVYGPLTEQSILKLAPKLMVLFYG